MKKIAIVVAVLMVTVPALAEVTITATQVSGTEVEVTYTNAEQGTNPVRAIAIDVILDTTGFANADANIVSVTAAKTGESTSGAPGFGIFPASFNREIDADDPNWADVNYTPVAHPCDLPADTQPGIGTNAITIEMGSLYVGEANKPTEGSLFTFTFDNDCNVVMQVNASRGAVVMEDGNAPNPGWIFVGTKAFYCPPITFSDVAKWKAIGCPSSWCCGCQKLCDVQGDGKVNAFDLLPLKFAYGKPEKYDCRCDFNHDGKVNAFDLLPLKFAYGDTPCTAYNCPNQGTEAAGCAVRCP